MVRKKRLLITFEGIEGSGKSVQVGLLASKLKELGYDIVVTREPGGTRIGDEIRAITHDPENVDLTAVAEAYLMAASRAQHVREIIKPALEDGKIVISDRYIDSSLAYQGFGRELGMEKIYKLNEPAIEGIMSDLTILLDVSLEVGSRRRNSTRKVDRLDLQQPDFYKRVRKGYLSLAQRYKKRFVIIDGAKSVDNVRIEVWKRVERHLQSDNLRTGVR